MENSGWELWVWWRARWVKLKVRLTPCVCRFGLLPSMHLRLQSCNKKRCHSVKKRHAQHISARTLYKARIHFFYGPIPDVFTDIWTSLLFGHRKVDGSDCG